MMLSRRALLATLGGVCLSAVCAPAAWTQGMPPQSRLYLFNIPIQPLKAALIAYSNVVGAQIIYNSRLAEGRHGRAVIGLFSADTALRMLVEGTDLIIHHTGPHDITLVADDSGATPGAGPSGTDEVGTLMLDTLYLELPPGAEAHPDYRRYTTATRDRIRQTLSRSSETAYRTGELQVEVWIDQGGRLREAHVLRSSGSEQFDRAVARVLQTVAIGSPPPPAMPQPIRVTITGF